MFFYEDNIMDEGLLQNIVLVSAVLEFILIAALFLMQMDIYKYRRRIYFIKRDRERCNELLYSAKDGYFCFIYPDQKVKDPQKGVTEKCSRRLAVILGLADGTASTFENVVDSFVKEDAGRLRKYVSFLQRDGKAFEDILTTKTDSRYICVYGNRVNGFDNNLYCDVVWFRDVSARCAELNAAEEARQKEYDKAKLLEDVIDGLNFPVWLRDENLHLAVVNKKYAEFSGEANKDEVVAKNCELSNNKGEAVALKAAEQAQKSKKMQKKNLSLVHGSELYNFEVRENPYFSGDTLDKIGTIGYLRDITDLEKLKRNFKINQNNHLEILSTLGTAFAIFNDRTHLFFYNTAFRNLWGLDSEFLDKTPTYLQFLEVIREHKMLPPVPDFKAFKADELSIFGSLWETKEDLLHLPDGRTIRRFRTPHPNGVIFAFEDVSDRLATMRRLNELTAMLQDVLDNLSDSVLIFGANQRLKFYNRSYLKLWGLDFDKVQDEPKLEKMLSYQKLFFSHIDDWDSLKQTMSDNISQGRRFNLSRDDNVNIDVSPQVFYDGSFMITYTVK